MATKATILSGIFDTIVLNDVVLRIGVKAPTALKLIIRFLSDNIGQLGNSSKIVNSLKSEGIKTTTHKERIGRLRFSMPMLLSQPLK